MANENGSSVGPWIFGAVVVAAAAFVITRAETPTERPLRDPEARPKPIVARGDLAADERATVELFESAAESVVFVTKFLVYRDPFGEVRVRVLGTGSGFVWDESGVIVTNLHVLTDERLRSVPEKAVVTLSDGTDYEARLVGYEANKDIAVLRIDAPPEKLVPLNTGTSTGLLVGQKTFAIGNPFGLDRTLTTGVISGLDRVIDSGLTGRPIQGVIQTDAAINPGNSGGPLLDSAGLLIGMNTAIQSSTGSSAGVGYAIPVDTLNEIVPALIRDGAYRRVGFGVRLTDARDAFVDSSTGRVVRIAGPRVEEVTDGSGAAAAGIEPGDLIYEIEGERTRTGNDVFRLLDTRKAGDEVAVTLLRQGREVRLTVTLAKI